jgi:hypothetical protein
MVARKARSHEHELVQGSGSQIGVYTQSLVGLLHKTNTESRRRLPSPNDLGMEATSCSRGLRCFTTKPLSSLVAPQSQHRRLGGRRRDSGTLRNFNARGMRRDHRACVGRTQTAAKVWPPDENIQVLTILP